MTGLDYAALGLLVFLALLAAGIAIFLAMWPGRVANARGHPHAEAIAIGGWATLIFGGVFWPLVLIWANAGAPTQDDPS